MVLKVHQRVTWNIFFFRTSRMQEITGLLFFLGLRWSLLNERPNCFMILARGSSVEEEVDVSDDYIVHQGLFRRKDHSIDFSCVMH